jgi:cytidine deaminase
MTRNSYYFDYEVYTEIGELTEADAWLLTKARDVTKNAYAPYSNFHVGAAARLFTGDILTGTNQENASYPVGLCAERVLLASISSLYPNARVDTIALSYNSKLVESDHPITPCGICRQSLQEYEDRVKQPIRLILGGMEGKIIIIPKSAMLLPLSFSGGDLS